MRQITISLRALLLFVAALASSLGALAGVVGMAVFQPQPARELPLYASATDTGSGMSMATGMIDGEIEGVFFLEFSTGQLTAVVLNPRNPAQVLGLFKADVAKDIGAAAEKKPSYLMTTGYAKLVGKGIGVQPAQCLVYVLDQNSGNFVGYGLNWNVTKARTGVGQIGPLLPQIKENISAVKSE